MNCKNCGTPLMGMEHACPVCGAPLPTNTPQPNQQPAMPGVPMPEQLASQPPQMMPGGAPPAGLPQEVEPAPEPKKGNNIFAILLLLVAFAAIGVGVFLAFTDEEEPAKSNNTPTEEEQSEPAPAENVAVNYAGYSFTIPDGFSASVQGEHGLVVRGSEIIYSILIDYTKGYDYYKQEFQKQTKEPTDVVKVQDKEYVLCNLTDGEEHASEYMTQATDTSTFAGVVVKPDHTKATEEDMGTINQILTTAVKQTDVAPGSEEDAGKEQIVNYMSRFKVADFAF